VRDGNELFDYIAKNCYTVTEVEKSYEQFYKDYYQIRIPTSPGVTYDIHDYPAYCGTLDAMETDAVISVEMMVHALLDQVAKRAPSASAAPDGIPATIAEGEGEPGSKKEVISYLDNYFEKAMAHLNLVEFSPESIGKAITSVETKA
jgi:hypothetical protein